ncbi:MAG TPA: iron ABC transporter permease [Methylococcaceae bacterium]|nr:iron ABC transporter permease [Methylococcaceae bacterium]
MAALTENIAIPFPGDVPHRGRRRGGWAFAALLAALWLLMFAALLAGGDGDTAAVWTHLARRLPELLANTLVLALGVGLGTLALGAGLAWLTALHEFPGSRFFSWALVLPLALPAYVLGFVLIGLLDFSGPLQSFLREAGFSSGWMPQIRSRGGVMLALTLALYPYVYLLAREAFLSQGQRVLETAQSLGDSRGRALFRAVLPMSRPWLAAGVSLVLMETLADFGTVSVFNYETFTTAIYKAWYGLFSLQAAGQLAACLVSLALLLLVLEQRQRLRQRYALVSRGRDGSGKPRLHGWRAGLACVLSGAVLVAGFALPMAQLALWTLEVWREELDERYAAFLGHSVLMAAAGALLTVAAAFALTLFKRRAGLEPGAVLAVRLATLGYAVPGTVLAVGIVTPLAWLDQWLGALTDAWGFEAAPLLGGSLAVLLLAYLARFLAVAFGAVDSAMQRVTPAMEDASRSLGVSGLSLWLRLHLPLLRGGLLSGALLVFVDVMKEMPMTLLIRPFGWDNLAVRVFEMVSEGLWERAAPSALALALAGLLPVALLIRTTERSA